MVKPLEELKKIADKLNVPSGIDRYVGPETAFAVYAMNEVNGNDFCDNRAQAHIVNVRFDYTQPYNLSYQDKMFEIMDMLIAAGFDEPRIVIVNDNYKYRILQFSTEILI